MGITERRTSRLERSAEVLGAGAVLGQQDGLPIVERPSDQRPRWLSK